MQFNSVLLRAALAASDAILAHRDPTRAATRKPDGSPVTEADLAAEEIVLAQLSRHFPDVPVIAEERVGREGRPHTVGERFFLVDPLDGTREFVAGRDEFTVNIGLIEAGVPIAGVVVAPALAEGYCAEHGAAWHFKIDAGAISDARRIKARARPEALKAVASRSHATPETELFLDQLPILARVSYGSSLKICRLAEGAADIYPRFGRTMEWDTAAADAILRQAGGRIIDVSRTLLCYGDRHGSASDGSFANPPFIALGAWTDAETAVLAGAIARALAGASHIEVKAP